MFTVFNDRSRHQKDLKAFKSFLELIKDAHAFQGVFPPPPAGVLEVVSRILRFPHGVSRFSKSCRDA